jgi:Uma2 family endonuclease
VAGDLVVTPAPGRRHQRIVTDLVTLLNAYVREHDLGEVFAAPFDVLFAEGDYMEPDLLFVSKDRLGILSDRGVEGSPDLVVEVTSPSTADRDRGPKLERYRHYGVGEYWIVDPESRLVEVWYLADGALAPLVIPGGILRWATGSAEEVLHIDLHELFGSD